MAAGKQLKTCILALLMVPLIAHALGTSKTSEVLVLASAATQLTRTHSQKGRVALEVYNNGPNTIWCAFTSATAVVNKSRPVAPGTSWALDGGSDVDIYCKAATADQVTGAATVVSELFSD